jgi:hypothetical protein
MVRRTTNEIKDEPGEPIIVRSKMGDAEVTELEVKGIEDLTLMEKEHLLLQLARDRVKNPSSGPWEITSIIRDEWRAVKDILAQPVEIEIRDEGRDELFQVFLDITQREWELENIPQKNP